ncbi:MAG TPA: rhomboid family intramembrane serine protease [Thermodesulfobacteriota bacterium]|nr:rhomboid family intramembrane serine protease [Thermodesulfobacteriota bacterium]
MIPLRDTIRSRGFPFVNVTLIIVNVLIFFYEFSLGNDLNRFIYEYGLVPASLHPSRDIGLFERTYPFFTSMFLHGGWLHLIGNMLYLYIFGDNVEDRMGHFKYLIFYLLAGLGGAIAQVIFSINSTIPMVGASGAISGILGAYILFFPRSRILTLVPIFFFIQIIEIPAVVFLFFWFLMQLFYGVASLAVTQTTGGVAFMAHVGGFIAGFFLAKLFQKDRAHYNNSGWFSGIFK